MGGTEAQLTPVLSVFSGHVTHPHCSNAHRAPGVLLNSGMSRPEEERLNRKPRPHHQHVVHLFSPVIGVPTLPPTPL